MGGSLRLRAARGVVGWLGRRPADLIQHLVQAVRQTDRLNPGDGKLLGDLPPRETLRPVTLAKAGIPRGPQWAIIVAQAEEAQDNGAFTDEDGAQAWLTANQDAIMKETTRRLQKAQAAAAKKKAAMALTLKAKQAEQKAQARAVKEAKPAAAAQADS